MIASAMTDTGRRRNGLLGGKDLDPAARQRLMDWARRHDGVPELHDEDFALWRLGQPAGGLRRFANATARGWLLGDLFAKQPGTAPITAENLSTSALDSTDHGWLWTLTGQFALFLWQPRQRRLLLYRDGSSARGLYYYRHRDGSLVFSDQLDLLVSCPLVPRRLSRDGLHEYLRFLDISSPNTIYDNVFSVEPDQLCLHGPNGLTFSSRPENPPVPVRASTLDQAAAALDRRLADAVATRMANSDDLVVFLSGGVDSAYLCALAAEQRPGRPQALTVGFAEPRLDESGVAADIAGQLGVAHRVLRFSLADYRRAFDELAECAEYPFADPAGAPSLLAFRQAREFADLALDGTGADTLLGVMPARHQRIAVQYAARLPYPLRRAIAAAMSALPGIRAYRPLLDFGDPEEVLMRWGGWSRREISALCARPVRLDQTRFYRLFAAYPRGAHFARYSALLGNLPDDRIHVAAALTGLRVRFPFFDPAVEACVKGMPPHWRYAGGEHKRVLKQALARRLPRDIWDRPKHGFDFPFEALLRDNEHALPRAALTPENLRRLSCERTEPLERLARDFIAGDRRHRFRVWGLSVLTAWLERHDLSA